MLVQWWASVFNAGPPLNQHINKFSQPAFGIIWIVSIRRVDMSSPQDPDAHNARLISRAEGYGRGPDVVLNAVACHVEALSVEYINNFVYKVLEYQGICSLYRFLGYKYELSLMCIPSILYGFDLDLSEGTM